MTDTSSRLRFLRDSWHLSPDSLATRSGADVVTIRRAETGDVEPDRLTVWKLAEALCVRPEWLQTQGKLERLHRTLKDDVFAGIPYPDLMTAQRAYDAFRRIDNHDRAHEALSHQPLASRYVGSERSFPAQ